jgi:hypothetical protein
LCGTERQNVILSRAALTLVDAITVNAEPSARGYNWATLFLGDINTGNWPSRLGESQMRQ